jgi:regulator of RNase E activity RraA
MSENSMTAERLPAETVRAFRFVSIPNVSDAMDRLGITGHPRGILPTWGTCPRLVGTAATMKLVPVGESKESPVIGTLQAIMAGKPGDVLVIDFGGNEMVNSMGGVAGATAAKQGLTGCVSDGVVRDIDEYKLMNWPVFARGPIQSSIRNRCGFAGYGIEVQLGGFRVRPGDVIVGDENGVLVVPHERAAEVARIALQLKGVEDGVIAAVRRGEDPVEAHHKVSYDSMLQKQAAA